MASPGTAEIVALELSKALEPLARRLQDEHAMTLIAELGLELPHSVMTPRLETAFGTVVTSAEALPQASQDLLTAIDGGDTIEILAKSAGLIGRVLVIVGSFKTIADELGSLGPIPGLTAPDLAAFVAALPKRLLETMVVEYLENEQQLILALLELFGLTERTHVNQGSTDPLHPDYIKKELRFDRLEKLFTSPEDLVRDLYQWGLPNFDGELAIERLTQLLEALDIVVTRKQLPGTPPRPALEIGLVTIAPTPPAVPPPPGLEATLMVSVAEAAKFELPITAGLTALLSATGALEASVGARIQPPVTVTLIPPSGSVQGQASAGLAVSAVPPAERILLLGVAGGTGLSVRRVTCDVISGFTWNSAPPGRAEGDFGVEGHLEGGQLRIGMDEADGFLGKLLSGVSFEADFDVGFGWSAGGGIYFTGSAVLEIMLPAHISLGPIDIDGLTLTVGMQGGTFPVGLAANIKAALGPLAATVEQVGAEVRVRFPADHSGNLGVVDVGFGFKPPKGVGLVIDAGVVKGGGYLFFDFDKEEYAGALELMISGIVSVKAIGLITTKMPDGSKGFSLLIIITAEFGTGIQLGFGFTLIGVGGLLGLNRTVRLEPLADGVRTGAVNNIMFPQDVVANAPRIISDLRTIFPPEQGKFLIGPMAKLGWGTPALISLSLGIIIEIPGNLAILGVLRCILPTEDAAILVLQVAFVGAIEFDKKRLWLFAGLFESRVLFITLEGEMGVLAAFGDDANFVISVGGFHPQFTPPPLPFPVPKRLALDLLNEPGERIRIEGYFAVTTNTVQFGARAELVFGFDDFGLHGHLGFDALFQFSPFYFIIHIGADLSLDAFGVGLFSVDLDFKLEGPTPYRAHGRGSVSLLFFDISADFDITWGETRDTTLPPIDIMPPLAEEFDKLENWKAFLPANTNLLVSLRHLDPATEGLVLHPLGTLRVTQRYVPLDSNIDKVGTQKPHDAKHFTLQVTSADLVKIGDVQEQFAPAQFHDMSNADKLSKPAYAPEHGGLELSASGQQLNSSQVVKRIARYEQIIIDTNFKRFARKFRKYSGVLFDHFLKGNAVSKSALSVKYKQQMQPFKETIKAGADRFTVAFNENNKTYKDEAVFTSFFAAEDYMARAIAANPDLADGLHVIPHAEVNRIAA